MSKNVFILGAGCSFDSGVPLMNGFLQRSEDVSREDRSASFKQDFEMVLKGRVALTRTHSKSKAVNVHNLEAVFSAFEMAKLLGKLGDFTPDQLMQFPEMYKVVIARTIELSQQYKAINNRLTPPKSYELFSNLLKQVGTESSSIITFNYDVGLDHALFHAGVSLDYCLPGHAQSGIKVLKLHGSINWGTLDGHDIYPVTIEKYFKEFRIDTAGTTQDVQFQIFSSLPHFEPPGQTSRLKRYPVVVPPTWNKSEYHSALSAVWKAAAKELSEAEHIFIMGYSLPSTDQFFHLLWALGSASDSLIRRIVVVNPDEEAGHRVRLQLGSQSEERFEYFKYNFRDAIHAHRKEVFALS